MLDSFRLIWVREKPKAHALWETKREIREAKDEARMPEYSIRNWTAWVPTGDPR